MKGDAGTVCFDFSLAIAESVSGSREIDRDVEASNSSEQAPVSRIKSLKTALSAGTENDAVENCMSPLTILKALCVLS